MAYLCIELKNKQFKKQKIMKTLKILKAIENEVEKYTEEDYDNMLNECYSEVNICGNTFQPAYALEQIDPIAYRCGFTDYQECETKYECPICGDSHDDEDDAQFCCQSREIYECEFCGETFEYEDDCQEHEDECSENPDVIQDEEDILDKTMDKCRDENF